MLNIDKETEFLEEGAKRSHNKMTERCEIQANIQGERPLMTNIQHQMKVKADETGTLCKKH